MFLLTGPVATSATILYFVILQEHAMHDLKASLAAAIF
jgi:hypothetical protein